VKKRIYLIMLVIALMAALVGGATVAWFTDQETNPTSTFTAGTLTIDVGNQSFAVALPEAGIAPGGTYSGTFTIKNTGSLLLKYQININTTGALFTGTNKVDVEITDDGTSGANEIAANNSVTVHFEVRMPAAAGNTFQGATGTLSFTVQATQTGNPHWNEAGTP